MMRLLIVADDETARHRIERASVDLVVSCGDLLDGVILDMARRVGCGAIVGVKGNHDSSGEFDPAIIDLHLKVHMIGGLRFGGFRGAWRYKPRGNFLYDQSEVAQLLGAFPPVDVFVAHNSPRHVHDQDDDVHLGFEAFNTYIERAKPKLFVHGHQHVNQETQVGGTRVLGVYGHGFFAVAL